MSSMLFEVTNEELYVFNVKLLVIFVLLALIQMAINTGIELYSMVIL